MSEYSGKKSRGRMVGLVFAMQGAGLVVGPLIASILLASGLSDNAVWRILLGIGAIPGLAVYYMRRRIHETPRFALAGGAAAEAEAAIASATGVEPPPPLPKGESAARSPHGVAEGFLQLVRAGHADLARRHRGRLGLLDFAYYGNTISPPEILRLSARTPASCTTSWSS